MRNAENLRLMYEEKLRYCAKQKKWYVYNGKNWEKDDIKQIDMLAKKYIRSVVQRAEESEDEVLLKKAMQLESNTKLVNMLRLFNAPYLFCFL